MLMDADLPNVEDAYRSHVLKFGKSFIVSSKRHCFRK